MNTVERGRRTLDQRKPEDCEDEVGMYEAEAAVEHLSGRGAADHG